MRRIGRLGKLSCARTAVKEATTSSHIAHFAADFAAVTRRDDGFVGADAELVETVWMPIAEARKLDIPGITAIVLEELQDRILIGMSHDQPVPLYRMLHKKFLREIL